VTPTQLLVWLVALPVHVDGHHHPIPRPYGAALTIANVAAETELPQVYAAMLDVLAAHESGYRNSVTGDSGRSCGAYQTPCARTPPDGLGQTRLALALIRQANDACPGHPLWLYASGRCASTWTAAWYEREVHARLAL
jgi:hypothetical protein